MQKNKNKFFTKENNFISISKQIKSRTKSGFTLIELLVVIAIIGILSTVVVVSLNSAREKGNITAIKSTLKQLYNQAEINYVNNGSYTGSNPSNIDLTCSGNLAPIAKTLIDKGIIVKCLSYNGFSNNDIYKRFGATAIIYDTTELKAWSVDENGVVKWDTMGIDTSYNYVYPEVYINMNYIVASNGCTAKGGRLPSVEQAISLSRAWREGSGNTTYTPVGFQPSWPYWTSTVLPSNSQQHYGQSMNGASPSGYGNTGTFYTRCVR